MSITPFFMFSGQAEEAINFYISLFNHSSKGKIFHNEDGSVQHATFKIKDKTFMAIDNTNQHDHSFTPAISFFVTCDTEEEIERVFAGLAEGGEVLMPLAASPFSEKYGWVQDRYGVSWQLTL